MKNFLKYFLASFVIFFFMFWIFENALAKYCLKNWKCVDSTSEKNCISCVKLDHVLFKNDNLSEDKKKIKTFNQAIWAIIKMITWVIWWFAVLWTILWWFFILISWWNESLVTKWKKTIGFSLIWIAVSLVSYTLIQLVQMFLFSFSK